MRQITAVGSSMRSRMNKHSCGCAAVAVRRLKQCCEWTPQIARANHATDKAKSGPAYEQKFFHAKFSNARTAGAFPTTSRVHAAARNRERESSACHGRAGVHRRGTGICPSHYGPRRCAKRRASAESFHRCATAGAQSAVPAGAIGRFTRRGAWGHAAPRAMETPRRPAPISAWKPFRNALNEPSGQEASGVPFEAPLTQSLSRRGLLQASGGKGFWGIVQR